MKSNKINICALTLLVLHTNIVKASSVTCVNLNEQKPAPLLYPITPGWTLSKIPCMPGPSLGYSLDLVLTQTDSGRQPIRFPSITLLLGKDVGEKVTIVTDKKVIKKNKFTFKDQPTKGSEIVIFVNPDDDNSYDLGYFKYRSPADDNDYWGIISDYVVGPDMTNPRFIDSYSLIGSKKYMRNPGVAEHLHCDEVSS